MSESRIAYFSMEVALHPAMPTYSGGLGILAGDMLRAAADRELPMVAITLLHRKGYFYQTLDRNGWQTENPVEWIVEDFLQEMPQRATVTLEGARVQLRASLYDKLERVVVPLFYRDRERFIDVMRHAIALNGSFFNTQRMVLQYVTKAYFR